MLSVCSQCRNSLFGTHSNSWMTLSSVSFRWIHSGSNSSQNRRAKDYQRHQNDLEGHQGDWQTDSFILPHQPQYGSRRETRQPRAFSQPVHEASQSPTRTPFKYGKESTRTSPRGGDSDNHRRPKLAVWTTRSTPGTTFKQASNTRPTPRVDPEDIPAFFEGEVQHWSEHRALEERFQAFGIQKAEIRPLLKTFVSAVQSGSLSTPEGHERYGLPRFAVDLVDGPVKSNSDIIYSTIFFAWASDPAHEPLLESAGISSTTITHIQALSRATDRSFPAEEYADARKMHRKVIMHVGPTNSGKTHNALRALAASGTGVYAGPLRLLAHEIWERLNLGQIVPLGVEEAPVYTKAPAPEPDTESALDVGGKAAPVRKVGNPLYARSCNMVTGEEQKIVAEGAPLLSCTVEMLSTVRTYDVAVVDEIQMIADEFRGTAWTRAVLGLCAKEVHLCGEETAVPVVRELLKDTGDELIINRYERLTPLFVEEKSLEGDLSRVRKGDCIVTFSRSNIFGLKRKIESTTSMRCAVVYGMLPPEIRSEQAALFNDPDSGYDVIIGSDAIGMGLNLKIRRVIFEAVRKWDGMSERPLSISQTKQIAGRAGRYGLHGDEQPGGYTTSLLPDGVDFIRDTLAISVPPLPYGRIGATSDSFQRLSTILPPGCSSKTIFDAHRYISRLPPTLRFSEMGEDRLREMCDFVDTRCEGLPLSHRLLLLLAPIAWRDPACVKIITRYVTMYRDDMYVDLIKAVEDTSFMANLETIEGRMRSPERPRATSDMLSELESFHKALVLYAWMSFRQPIAWNQQNEVADLKERVELALEWTLQAMTRNSRRVSKSTQRPKQRTIPYRTPQEMRVERAARA
ncbi:hypothetical protein DXG03_002095 [Asterophora parasitica]|uniref:RNA helicase n=1 Tax=Asterophora parasitica TaxID=117018 RepID=A0A9P7KCF4_9AGAR|nr:hypothetical protein DXG03_002095 [Asterophora parasitica]